MNITDRLAETVFRPSCWRCGTPRNSRAGWQASLMLNDNNMQVGWHPLCPACVVDYEWWLSHPPENPDTDSLSSTPDLLEGEADAVRRPL